MNIDERYSKDLDDLDEADGGQPVANDKLSKSCSKDDSQDYLFADRRQINFPNNQLFDTKTYNSNSMAITSEQHQSASFGSYKTSTFQGPANTPAKSFQNSQIFLEEEEEKQEQAATFDNVMTQSRNQSQQPVTIQTKYISVPHNNASASIAPFLNQHMPKHPTSSRTLLIKCSNRAKHPTSTAAGISSESTLLSPPSSL